MVINPAAMPAGTELSFGYFRRANGVQTFLALINIAPIPAPPTLPPLRRTALRYSASAAAHRDSNPQLGAAGRAAPFVFRWCLRQADVRRLRCQLPLKLLDSATFQSGVVRLTYAKACDARSRGRRRARSLPRTPRRMLDSPAGGGLRLSAWGRYEISS